MDVHDQAILRKDHYPIGTTPAMQWSDPNVVSMGQLGQMVQLFMATPAEQREKYEINLVAPGPPGTTGMESASTVLSSEEIVDLSPRPEFASYQYSKWLK